MLAPNGAFNYPADVNREQYERTKSDPNWRFEIVGNLAAVRTAQSDVSRSQPRSSSSAPSADATASRSMRSPKHIRKAM